MNEFKRFVTWAGGAKAAAALLGRTVASVYHLQNGTRQISREVAIKVVEVSGKRFSVAKMILGTKAA